MDKQQRQTNEAAEELTEAARASLEAAVDRAFAAQENNVRLARNFFEDWINTLETQAELNRHTLQNLAELAREQREAFQGLSRESLEAYDSFLDSLFSHYRGVSDPASHTSRATTAPFEGGKEAIRLLEEWLSDESGYDEETWPELKAALNRNRPSSRQLFVD